MKFELIEKEDIRIFKISSDELLLSDESNALDIISNSKYQEVTKIIIAEENIAPEFFDLKTTIAGNIMQKFTLYGVQLAIVGDFSKYESKSLHDFIFETNKQGQILFLTSEEEATERLTIGK